VGGGWDTLEHFLERHDPCQVRVLGREVTPSGSRSNSRSSGLNRLGLSSTSNGVAHQSPTRRASTSSPPVAPSEGFLHIRAKYRSPPPARS
jgi:growth arrest-specific protein 2